MISTTVSTDDAPLFRSGHEALRFAYAYNPEQYPMTLMARMMHGVGIGSGRGLYGTYGAAVAGSIKRIVATLPEARRDALICRYARTESDYIPAMQSLLRPAVAALGTGIHPTRLVLKLICRYYNRPAKIKLSVLCDEFALPAATMTRRWQRVRDQLRALESEAMSMVDDRFVSAGLVETGAG